MSTSSADSGSSSTSTAGLAATARASASRWRWPPERLRPSSPIIVSTPVGQVVRRSRPARSRAPRADGLGLRAAVPSRRPSSTLSRTDAENSVASSNAMAMCVRSSLAGEVAHVDAVERHAPAGHVVQARGERGERRLARAGEADERHGLARLEHRGRCRRAGRARARASPGSGSARPRTRAPLAGRRSSSGSAGSMIVFSSSITSKKRSVAVRVSKVIDEQEADRLHRPAQHGRRREERDELADRDLAVRREPARRRAGTSAKATSGTQHQPEPDAGDRARLLDLGAAQLLGLAGEVLERVLAAPERLEHADAVHGLLDGGREVAGLVLAAGARRPSTSSRTRSRRSRAASSSTRKIDAEQPVAAEQQDEADQRS